jgi:hypothetical protein
VALLLPRTRYRQSSGPADQSGHVTTVREAQLEPDLAKNSTLYALNAGHHAHPDLKAPISFALSFH